MASSSPYTQMDSSPRPVKSSGSSIGSLRGSSKSHDHSSEPSTLYRKRKWLFVISGISCCLAILLIVGLVVVPVLLLTKTKLVEQTPPKASIYLEFFDICASKNPLRFGTWLKNPSWIGAQVHSGTVYVYRKVNGTKGNAIATAELPALKLVPGVQYIDVTAPVDLVDPSAVGGMINDMILQQNITLYIELKVKASAIGFTLPLTLPFEFTLPDPTKPKAPPATANETVQMQELGFTRVDAATLEFLLSLQYNWSIDGIVVHLPPLSIDVLYEGAAIANATVPAFTLTKGWVPITALVSSPVDAANYTSGVVQNLLTSTPFNLSITGAANGGLMCPNAAALLRQITFILQLLKPEDPLAKSKKQSGAPAQKKISVSMVNVTKIDDEAVEISAKYQLAGLPFPIKGIIPNVILEYFSEIRDGVPRMGYIVASVDIGQSIATLRVVCEQPYKLGRWIGALFVPNQPTDTVVGDITLLPRNADDVNIVTKLLQRWNYTQGLGTGDSNPTPEPTVDSGASVSVSFGILNVTVLGAKGPQNLVVGIGISLGNTLINVQIPALTVAVDENVWSPGDTVKHPERLAVISLAALDIRASPSPVEYYVQISLTTAMSLRETVDRLFKGGTGDTFRIYGCPVNDPQVAAMTSPDPLVQKHLIQRIMSALEYRLGAAPSQPADGAKVTAGGVMPKVDYNITSTTNDTASAMVWLNVSLPIPLPIHLGNLNIYIAYHSARLVSARLLNTDLMPGVNTITVQLSLDATGMNRDQLESLISNYVFGKPVDSIVLSGSLYDPDSFLYSPINLTYPFALPSKASGASGSSSPLPCIDTLALKPGVDISGITRLQLPSCQINGQLGVWFKNPIPFPLQLNKLSMDAYFSDPDGLVGFPWVYIADVFPGQFDPISERLIFQVREPVGSSTLVVPCAPPDCYSKQLPVMFEVGETDTFLVVLRTDPLTNTADPGLWNTCVRLAEQKFNNKLFVNLRNASVQVQLFNFVLNVAFEVADIPIGGDTKPPCRDQLGMQNVTRSPTR